MWNDPFGLIHSIVSTIDTQSIRKAIMKTGINRKSIPYYFVILLATLFPLSIYPNLYGTDAFQIIWMANAIRNGTLLTENTWLIHPLSIFGNYPFSHRAIGVPLVLAILSSLVSTISLGVFGLPESVLIYDFILIFILYKCCRYLSNKLFEEEWSRYFFTAAVLLSPSILESISMTVSTRIVITIVMIALISLSLEIIDERYKFRNITIIMIILLILISAFSHRLWPTTLIPIFFVIFLRSIREYVPLQKWIAILLFPLCIVTFIVGLLIFPIDSAKILSPFFDNSTLIGIVVNLGIHYMLDIGLILLFFPVGIMMTLYKEFYSPLLASREKKDQSYFENTNQPIEMRKFYLLLFVTIFSFMAPTFYATTIFLPILVIFSIYGMRYSKEWISKISDKKVHYWVFPFLMLLFSIGYSILYSLSILSIDLWYMNLLIAIVLIAYLTSVLTHRYGKKTQHKFLFRRFIIYDHDFRKQLKVFMILVSVLLFSATTITGRWSAVDSSPYPWEVRYLTMEEQDIISFLDHECISGLIYTYVPLIANRISAAGFLPVITDKVHIGTALYLDLITPDEVHQNTIFSFDRISKLIFFTYNATDPIRSLRNSISRMNVSLEEDLYALKFVYDIHYLITANTSVLSCGANWILIQSLSSEFSPVLSTENLFVWKLY